MSFPFAASGTGSDQELLDLVREAIATIAKTGQEVEIRGRRVTRADLEELVALENILTRRLSVAGGPARTFVRLARKHC
jgi:hypothetical protein